MTSLSRPSPNPENSLQDPDRRGIVFINDNVSQCKTLIQQIDPQLRVIVVSRYGSTIREITKILASSYCQEIYLIAQGKPGCLYLGSTELSLNTLLNHSSELESWFQNSATEMTEDFRLYLYGSDVAAGDAGAEYIAKLGSIVGATIFASPRVSKNNILR